MQIRRQNKRTNNKSYLATMTMLGFITSTSRRAVVRAAFTAGDVGGKAAFGRVGCTNTRPFVNHANSSPKFALYEREPTNRAMSTAMDEELDSALNDLLGEALKEAEEPAAGAGSGHIEGSHPFPKELVETVCSLLHYVYLICLYSNRFRSHTYPFNNNLRKKTLQILNFFLLPIHNGHNLVSHKM